MLRYPSRRLCQYLSLMKISLYIHIPFCIRKCLYCDFLSGPYDAKVRSLYVDALIRELSVRSASVAEYEVISIFFGGGTPSVLDKQQLSRIMDALKSMYHLSLDCEITMEVNPGTIGRSRKTLLDSDLSFDNLIDSGINRLSFGLQSANSHELISLGRIHTVDTFLEAYSLSLEAGFNNINVDLMSGIPGQTVESLKASIQFLTTLSKPPTHISVYDLIIEEGTAFSKMYKNGSLPLPTEDEDRVMYKITGDLLNSFGYRRYEISNYALPGYECRHNKVYWKRGNYLGFGIGAASLLDNCRWKNTSSMEEYLKSTPPLDEEYQSLSIEEQMEEYMFLGLRMTEGISLESFEEALGVAFPTRYQEIIRKYESLGLIKTAQTVSPSPAEDGFDKELHRVMLTEEGINISNTILAEFIF